MSLDNNKIWKKNVLEYVIILRIWILSENINPIQRKIKYL